MNQQLPKLTLVCVALTGFAITSAFAADFKKDVTGVWSDDANWEGDIGAGMIPRIGGVGGDNSIVTLDTVETVERFIFGQGGTGSSLTVVSGGSLTTSDSTDHRFGQTSAFTVNLETGGTINVANAKITSDAGGIFNINGGDFDAKDYTAGKDSKGTVNVNSSSATIDIAGTSIFGEFSEATFDFGGGSTVSTWNTLDLTITSGATLKVVGSDLMGVGTYDLLTYTGTLAGAFTTGSITGLSEGLSGSILSDGDSIYLRVIPEPGTYALLSGMLAIGYAVLRRRK